MILGEAILGKSLLGDGPPETSGGTVYVAEVAPTLNAMAWLVSPEYDTLVPTLSAQTVAISPAIVGGTSLFKFLPGVISDGDRLYIPVVSLVGVSAAEANAETGDIRSVLQGFALRVNEYMQDRLSVNTSVTLVTDSAYAHAQLGTVVRYQITAVFPVAYRGAYVASEP